MSEDIQQIKILAIFHFVLAAYTAVTACLPIFMFFIGLTLLIGNLSSGEFGFLTFFSIVYMFIPLVIIFVGWTLAILMALAGYFLLKTKYYTFCFVVAAISTIRMPFGTALGILTMVVLMRPSVKALFTRKKAAETETPSNEQNHPMS